MAKDALNHFANILLEEASAQKKELLSELESKRNACLKKTDAKLKEKAKAEIRKGTIALKLQKQLSLTRRETELHKALLQNRQRTFDEVFAKVEENARAFAKTPSYTDFLKTLFQEAVLKLQSDSAPMRCCVMPQDMTLAKEIFSAPNLEILPSDQDFIGGFTLENTALKRFVDCTLAARIQEQKNAFYETSGLIIE